MELRIEEHDYPNPSYKWVSISLDGMEIGRCNKTPEGLVPIGKRKPIEPSGLAEALVRGTLADARKRMKAAAADESRALLLLQKIRASKKHLSVAEK